MYVFKILYFHIVSIMSDIILILIFFSQNDQYSIFIDIQPFRSEKNKLTTYINFI